MSEFERPLQAFRLVETHWNDDLQAVAARELGNANRWPELVWLNTLRPPYITNDRRRVTDGVLMAGSLIKVPATTSAYTDDATRGQVFERDCIMVGKRLQMDDHGDFAIVSGAANLRQQLQHRVDTPRGQARRHPEYGCMLWRILGTINGPLAGAMGAAYVKAALVADYRVASVPSATAAIAGDVVKITAVARAIEGGAVDISSETKI